MTNIVIDKNKIYNKFTGQMLFFDDENKPQNAKII